ncbi:MAG: HAD family hydrolase [Gemmatimonadetes bacterium]|nr:HAD family hydrolase [Gemmatimonadota bacterium]
MTGAGGPRPAVFLDRDGTLIVERDYLADPEDVRLERGAAEAVRRLRESGYAVVVVTNQSGIARGLYTEEDYSEVAARVEAELARCHARVDATYHCPHHPDVTGPCACRKPGLGMYRQAARELGLDLARSFFVGDKVSDVEPARALGGRGILVRTGYGARHQQALPPGVGVADDLLHAADLIAGPGGSLDG